MALPAQTASYFLYDEKPLREDAILGAGSLATGTQTGQSANSPYALSYTFPSIDDPDPSASDDNDKTFWEAIVYVSELGQQTQLGLRSFVVARTYGTDSVPGTTVPDVKAVFPSIANYMTDQQIGAYLTSGELETRNYFTRKGIAWSRLFDLDQLKMALAYKAISDMSLASIVQPNDKHAQRYEIFKVRYNTELKALSLAYDSNKDGQPDTKAQALSFAMTVLK